MPYSHEGLGANFVLCSDCQLPTMKGSECRCVKITAGSKVEVVDVQKQISAYFIPDDFSEL